MNVKHCRGEPSRVSMYVPRGHTARGHNVSYFTRSCTCGNWLIDGGFRHILELSPIKTSKNKPEQFDVLVIDFQLFVYHTFSELLIFPPCSQEFLQFVYAHRAFSERLVFNACSWGSLQFSYAHRTFSECLVFSACSRGSLQFFYVFLFHAWWLSLLLSTWYFMWINK